tara:strand:- start:423 stop:728 length:306 start_codon:yes stop_codon:yes gene_type:complete
MAQEVQYKANSNYSQTDVTKTKLDTYIPPFNAADAVPDQSMIITAKYHRRPDLLANDLYNSPRLWWVFYYYNVDALRDPINDFTSGKEISYPNKATLEGLI